MAASTAPAATAAVLTAAATAAVTAVVDCAQRRGQICSTTNYTHRNINRTIGVS
jgi:hypothetical protein